MKEDEKNLGSPKILFSIIVPVYSGEAYLSNLVAQIKILRESWQQAGLRLSIGEVIFVLDSPIDQSSQVLMDLAERNQWMRVVNLSRNYGQHSATVAGILYSSGDWVVTMDEDMQHDPSQISLMLEAACINQADVVYASPRTSVHGGYRDRFSRFAKLMIAKLSGNRFVENFNSFRLIRGDIARAASSICAQHTYFDVALSWFTQRVSTVEMDFTDDRYTTSNSSGYKLSTLISHAKRLVLTSDFRILRFTNVLAGATLTFSIIYGFWAIYSRFFASHTTEIEGWTSLVIVILAFGSAMIFMLGLIIEFLHISMLQLQGKPSFFVVNRSSDPDLRQEVEKMQTLCKS